MADAQTSKSLLAKARDCSDQSAWRRLTELYEPLIWKWVRPHVAQRADAEDVVQEVLTTVSCPGLITTSGHARFGPGSARSPSTGCGRTGRNGTRGRRPPEARSWARTSINWRTPRAHSPGRGMTSTIDTSSKPCSARSGWNSSRRPGEPSSFRLVTEKRLPTSPMYWAYRSTPF